jgi:hypothetical protein
MHLRHTAYYRTTVYDENMPINIATGVNKRDPRATTPAREGRQWNIGETNAERKG